LFNIRITFLYLLNKQTKTDIMKQFKLSFEDKQGNELTVRVVDAYDQRDADAIAEIHFAASMINDLFIIRVTELN